MWLSSLDYTAVALLIFFDSFYYNPIDDRQNPKFSCCYNRATFEDTREAYSLGLAQHIVLEMIKVLRTLDIVQSMDYGI